MSSATHSDLLEALENGERLLLPNARAARELRTGFDARQRRRGLLAWESPQIASWSQWINSQWNELVVAGAEGRLLLNAAQEHSLWREIVSEDPASRVFGSVDSLAELAASAWQLAANYNAAYRLREFGVTHDSRVFAEWAEAFSRRCEAKGYMSAALLEAALLEHVRAGRMVGEVSLTLVGFGELLPSQKMLLAGLRDCGTLVEERELTAPARSERLLASVVAANEREELLLAMRWVRSYLEEPQAKERGTRVAVLLPNVSEERSRLEEVLREVLAPELQSIEADLSSTPWEFSGGVPLASVEMIGDALALAQWAESALPLTRVSSLLRSPYVGDYVSDSKVRNAVASFDAHRLRRMVLLRSEIEIASVLELANRAETAGGQALFAWLRRVQEFRFGAGGKNRLRGFAEWMEFVRGLMQAANWPGDRALTASEFEATRAWESTLDLVSTLDFSGRRVEYASALEAIASQVKKTIFARPATDVAVQIMGVSESRGSVFDAVVFLHATDANLPASERVHPLLPWALQRSLKMPGSEPVLSERRGRSFLEDLLGRSGDALFTCAAEDDSGRLRPSPLLAEMAIEPVEASKLIAPGGLVEPVAIEDVFDEVELRRLPSNEVTGGANVLRLQAACGFLAFAALRLGATEPMNTDLGIDASESGSIVHRALQYFWETVGTQEALRSMSLAERDEVLERVIDQATNRKLQVRNAWDRAYLDVYKERLRAMLRQWLDEELRRGPFTVLAVEQNEMVSVGPLTLKVRMDRIDKVGEGVFLVDYKTGYAAHPKQWIGERPDDPQLPLYTLLPEVGELKGVAFAKVRAGRDMKWLGYQAEEGILPVSKSRANVRDLASMVEEWRGTLTRLAEDFAVGRADVWPKSVELNCARCAQRVLCRIDPRSMLDVADDADGVAEDVDG